MRSIITTISIIFFSFFLVFYISLSSNSLFALDELFLTGKIINYDPGTGIIKIDVSSDSCKGIREFFTIKGLHKDKLINKTIYFGIDSDHCDKSKIHRITISPFE